MKKALSLLFTVLLLADVALASSVRKNAILANVGTIMVGNYELSYERSLSKHFSISTTLNYYEGRKALWRVFSYGYQIGAGITPKVHVFGQAHKNSFYLAPSLRMGYLEHPTYQNEEGDKGLLSRFGFNFGYGHVFDCGLMTDLMAGLEHYHTFSFSKPATPRQSEGGILIRPYFAVGLGYAF